MGWGLERNLSYREQRRALLAAKADVARKSDDR
jgi:hypothetical protein